MIIENGVGNGNKLKIDSNNRALTESVTQQERDHAADTGDKHNINTGDITLTDATVTSVLYFKNNEDADIIVTDFIYNLGNSTSGTGDVLIEIIRNPTAGTIISDAVNVAVGTGTEANMNFGASNVLLADIYKGDTADNNFTDGSVAITTRLASSTGRTVISLGAVVIPKGSSIGVAYTPPASNSSQICQFAMACYLRDESVAGI